MEELYNSLQDLVGRNMDELSVWQMLLRAAVIYIGALILLRLGEKRFLGKSTAFDVILGIMFGSVLSRGINGTALIFETLAAGGVLVLLHWALAALAFRTNRMGPLVKGNIYPLIKDGEIDWETMGQVYLTENDLMEALRIAGHVQDPADVQYACLERSGKISVIPRGSEPRVVEVDVQEGVQRVRIELT